MVAEYTKGLFVSAAGLGSWGQHCALTNQEAKKHLVGSGMVGILGCRMSHVVSGAAKVPGSNSRCLAPSPEMSVKAEKQIGK